MPPTHDAGSQARKRPGRRALLRGLAAATLAAPSLARAHGGLHVTDAIGRNIALKGRAAERIVCCFNFEEFTAVAGPAGWDRVVGVSRSWWHGNRAAAFPRYAAAIPRLENLADPGNMEAGNFSVEAILALRPDLVIVPEIWLGALQDAVGKLTELGIPWMVIDYNAQIPERHVASTLALGAVTGNAARAGELAALYTSHLAEIRQRAAAARAASGRAPKVYVELGQGGADTIGNTYWKGMWGRILDLLGAENIAAGKIAGAWGPLNPEYVLAANPDVIFIAGSSWVNRPQAVITGFDADLGTLRARLAGYTQRRGWPDLAAIRAGQLHAIEHGLCRSLFDYTAITYIAKQLYPAAFEDMDPVAELRRYHERYLPVAFSGTWMARLA